jgi:hypothetical protein
MDFHVESRIQFSDIPDDIMHNQISKYLLEDKQINKVFNEKDDYYLLNMLFGKIWDVKYIIPSSYNEYKSTLNLDCIKTYLNTRHDLNCDSLRRRVLNGHCSGGGNSFVIQDTNRARMKNAQSGRLCGGRGRPR